MKGMCLFNFSKKIIIALIIPFFVSCYNANYKTELQKEDGSDIILYQQDTVVISVTGSMKEWNYNFGIIRDDPFRDTDFVNLYVNLKNVKFVEVKKFSLKIWYGKSNIDGLELIKDGSIHEYNSFIFDKRHQLANITDTVGDYTCYRPSWGGHTWILFIVQSEPDSSIVESDYFVTDIELNCIINEKDIAIHQIDTLYKKVVRSHRIMH
jgi:hypothetical protein